MSEVLHKGVILLSGGLDSLVSLGLCKDEYNICLALTFDYGQKALNKEIEASKAICDYYKIEHRIIKLDFLKEITKTSLVSNKDVPLPSIDDLSYPQIAQDSAKAVWVPNRNGLFLNVAAAFADSFGYDCIIFGANSEEGATFPDNTQDFVDRINSTFEFSTLQKPKVLAPLINMDKNAIVKMAIEHGIPLEYVRSCYFGIEKHCGVCESCVRLKRALDANSDEKFVKILF